MKITAAVAHEPGQPFSVEEVEIDSPSRTRSSSRSRVRVCHTDLVAQEGAMGMGFPCVLGHEGSGVVLEAGSDVTSVAPGDHVAISFNSCGVCDMCESSDPAYCRASMGFNYSGLRLDGTTTLSKDGAEVASNFFGQSSLVSHAIAYERNVVKVDPDLPIELLGPLGCGIQTGAGSIMNALDCEPVRERLAFYASTVAYRRVLDLHDLLPLHEDLAGMAREGAWRAMGERIDDEVLDLLALVVDDPDDVDSAIVGRFGDLADGIYLYPTWVPDPAQQKRIQDDFADHSGGSTWS